MIWIRKHKSNPGVTDYYLETIGEAYKRKGENVRYFVDWDDYSPQSGDMTVISTYYEALKLIFKRKKFVWWIQGIRPEESYAVHKSWLRKFVLEIIEYIEVRKTIFPIFVSDAMKEHYESKYKIKFKNYYIMPCCNDSFKPTSFREPEKYEKNTFCYAGSLDTWQCVDEALMLYKKLEDVDSSAKLILLVKDKEKAIELLNKYGIKNYEIDFVPVSELPNKLKPVKFGFIIRENLALNRVATPTKLMTYMGNGVIPIVSDCLDGLLENVGKSKFVVKISDSQDERPILEFINQTINADEIENDYEKIYREHYDAEIHIKNMINVLPS
jgi:hypothetical protein